MGFWGGNWFAGMLRHGGKGGGNGLWCLGHFFFTCEISPESRASEGGGGGWGIRPFLLSVLEPTYEAAAGWCTVSNRPFGEGEDKHGADFARLGREGSFRRGPRAARAISFFRVTFIVLYGRKEGFGMRVFAMAW